MQARGSLARVQRRFLQGAQGSPSHARIASAASP
jgi:hypothetical protein